MAKTRLRRGEVRGVLNALAGAALARPLDATQEVWELSRRLRRWRRLPLPRSAVDRPDTAQRLLRCADAPRADAARRGQPHLAEFLRGTYSHL